MGGWADESQRRPFEAKDSVTCFALPPTVEDGTWYSHLPKLQAMLYDILPSTTAVFSYVIGS